MSTTSPKHIIALKGARTHNLKNLTLNLPHNQLITITGPSGSGKTSLAFYTLFAEGQRRYIESLSAYARQFLGKIPKPSVDYIKGLLPSIGMQQKTQSHNPRSRVATTTGIYPYLKLLYARIGQTYSPISGNLVQKHTTSDVLDYIQSQPPNTKILIMAPLTIHNQRNWQDTLTIELRKGFTRLMYNGQVHLIEDLLHTTKKNSSPKNIHLIIDRLVLPSTQNQTLANRLADSVQTAFFEGQGLCTIELLGKEQKNFSDRFEADGIPFLLPTPHLFDFNNPYGACQLCGGLGKSIGIDPERVIPDPSLSLTQGAILPWQSHTMRSWKEHFISKALAFDFPIHKPYKDLSPNQQKIVWEGNKHVQGIYTFFKFVESKTYKIQYRVLQARYRGTTTCTPCRGTGLRQETNHVKIGGKNLIDLLCMPIDELATFFHHLTLTPHQQRVSKVLIEEITKRLTYLQQVGLGYLTLNRRTNTLSAGEYQRMRLARALGGTLVSVLYILDEPTAGLHPRDTDRLIQVLLELKKAGNTVIVVEHEQAVMQASDHIVDIGPQAGTGGGQLVFQGTPKALLKAKKSQTADYITGKLNIPRPTTYRTWHQAITLEGVYANNLKNITATLPLNVLTLITGVSGSGKSSLIHDVLFPVLARRLGKTTHITPKLADIHGDLEHIQHIEQVGQNSLGISARSNPATYTKVYDAIRKLFSDQPLARERSYTPVFFSFNMPGGRCEECKGAGQIKIEMQFLADVLIDCEACEGKRFKQEVLEVTFQNKNISQILQMTIKDALAFFKDHPKIIAKLTPLRKVGLEYMKLGQSSSTFSGGEAQRLKLSTYLSSDGKADIPTLFIFDEPTTGLHFRDIHKLMIALQELVDSGHTVVVIEHNTDVIKCADWIIDMGPEAGAQGGEIIFSGTPEQMLQLKDNATAKYLREKW